MLVQVLSLLADKAPSFLSHAPAPTLVNTNLVITLDWPLAVAAAEKPASQFRFQQRCCVQD